ncbi:hypothetical protein CC1G_06494 [Coprinopsis cinerea okayama7|uniref:C2H2-type domain-containing protein n=1 Tax=Coprinopsis cinerea (strain Okayama-7 / 130 / ATCC MYA-4618 / FGSC 9003) TaxID=240176 RepID=A8NNB5_COPC7|nr:hypothetical protein CC1G_06494 [Coprinopsis cinerea okayama7\|eukprot:XP_001835091.1 hypothetical protein CC1G_06494 [Coprinopsis cinerea okayama7\
MPPIRSAPHASSPRDQKPNKKFATHTCSECNKAFTRSTDLRRHAKIHDEYAARYVCTYPRCAYATLQRSNLRTHLATHTGEKRHECNLDGCTFRCADPASLIRHRKRIHGYTRQPRLRMLKSEPDVKPIIIDTDIKPIVNTKKSDTSTTSKTKAKATKRAPPSKSATTSFTGASDTLSDDWFDTDFLSFLDSIAATTATAAAASLQSSTIKPDPAYESAFGPDRPGLLDIAPFPETFPWDPLAQQLAQHIPDDSLQLPAVKPDPACEGVFGQDILGLLTFSPTLDTLPWDPLVQQSTQHTPSASLPDIKAEPASGPDHLHGLLRVAPFPEAIPCEAPVQQAAQHCPSASPQLPIIKPDPACEPASGPELLGLLNVAPIPETFLWDPLVQQPVQHALDQDPWWDMSQSFPYIPATPPPPQHTTNISGLHLPADLDNTFDGNTFKPTWSCYSANCGF